MNQHRVAVTGMGFISPLGEDWADVKNHFVNGISGIKAMPDWAEIEGLNTRVGAPVDFKPDDKIFTRKKTRAMGRVAKLATWATYRALEDAQLLADPLLGSGKMGIAYGSSAGSNEATTEMFPLFSQKTTRGINGTTYVRMMSHTAPVNIGVFFGIKGRIITTSSACTSGSQAIGYAYEAIASGKQTAMVAGGAEELHASVASIFDTLFAASSRYNQTPSETPRPFDQSRDGLVVGEGAGTLILEDYDHALARGAKIYAELVGFGTNSDGTHITNPQQDQMANVMRLALEDAQYTPEMIDYVNGHGTGTIQGDSTESKATEEVFERKVPFSTFKGYMGHTLGASGALEAIFSIFAMNENLLIPTLHLKEPALDCGKLNYVIGTVQHKTIQTVMSNNFAFGGINTSLIFKRTMPQTGTSEQ